ncbi:hypothetical protein CBP31_00785 [Oceanisphaera profunda]|uniref:Cadmium carbonic anhydrase n=1 Tax=Oceanisphaera profunda TaxID=1416627 RepID=A0A1Y0D296_9GAMM|nr:delta-class carbonic anhydrase [Oceanisphaera profunda]ART81347.1 hypothetical protein CBP31_00785 [Oceanisphaera profunda]
MKMNRIFLLVTTALLSTHVSAKDVPASINSEVTQQAVADQVLAEQRQQLAKNTDSQGFGPQSPRDIRVTTGENAIAFNAAPPASAMNLCNIHFHKNAEHAGGEFTTYVGNGDGQGYQGGYQYSGQLTAAELAPLEQRVCPSEQSSLAPGDTIEVHYVYSSANITPGPTLGACFNDAIKNPQLRVQAQVYVLVNDAKALDFGELNQHGEKNGLQQALNLPDNTGTAVEYAGSTTGPSFNEAGSPFQVSWSVKPKVAKVNIASVGQWCKSNVFEEDHAHGVRNLVTNPALLSTISQ